MSFDFGESKRPRYRKSRTGPLLALLIISTPFILMSAIAGAVFIRQAGADEDWLTNSWWPPIILGAWAVAGLITAIVAIVYLLFALATRD